MSVISMSAAGKLAGVSRQAIFNIKNNPGNALNFFQYNKITGKPGVDDEHADWKLYMQQRKQAIEKRSGQPHDNSKTGRGIDRLSVFVRAVCEVVQEKFGLSDGKVEELKVDFGERYTFIMDDMEG